MSTLDEIGDAAGWRCWLCDEPVDPEMSVNDPRGPSLDSVTTRSKAKAKAKKKKGSEPARERLAHRSCNTGKGAVAPVVPWPDDLFVIDPAPIIANVEALERKGGRVVMARCLTQADAEETAAWLVGRISRLSPDLEITTEIVPGGGQFMLALRA